MSQEKSPVIENSNNPESSAAKLIAAKQYFETINDNNKTAEQQQEARKALLAIMSQFPEFEGELSKSNLFLDLMMAKVPLLAGLLGSIDRTGGAVSGLCNVEGLSSQALQAAGLGFQAGQLTLTAIDFVRIPVVYIGSYIAGVPPPITLSQKGRWVYSGVLLGLGVAALAAPVAAPYIGVAIAGLGVVVSVASLAKMTYKVYKTRKDITKLEQEIGKETSEFNDLKTRINKLQQKLLDSNIKEDEAEKIRKELETLTIQSFKKATALQDIHNKRLLKKTELKKMGVLAFMDKGVVIGLGSLALAGAALSLVFPVVGLSILAGTAGLGLGYTAARIIVPIVAPYVSRGFKKVAAWLGYDFSKSKENKSELVPDVDISNQFKGLENKEVGTASSLFSRPHSSQSADPEEDDSEGEAPKEEEKEGVVEEAEEDDGEGEAPPLRP